MKYEKPSVTVLAAAAEVIQSVGKPGIQLDSNGSGAFNSTAAYEGDE
jgi:hypothetical protein